MLKDLFIALLCGLAIAGQMRAQEVVVAREAKHNSTERVEPISQGTDSESETATGMKPQVREKKSASTTFTVEQMRMAGALAAERQKRQARPPDKATPAPNNGATIVQNKDPRA